MSELLKTWWLLLLAGLATGWSVWLVQRACYEALQRHRQLYTSDAEHRLRDLFVFVDLRMLWPAAGVLGFIMGGVAVLIGLPIIASAVLASGCWCLPSLCFTFAKRQRTRTFEAQLPDALGALSASVRAGLSLGAGLQALVQHALPPLSQEFAVVNRQVRLGASVGDAMQQLASRLGGKPLQILSITIRVALQTGGPMAAMLEQTERTLRDQAQLIARLDALTSQGWLQAWVMAGMPVALIIVLGSFDENFNDQLLYSRPGHLVLGAVTLFECVGLWWLRRMTTIRFDT